MRIFELNMKAFEFNWKNIPQNSYLRELPSLRDLEKMEFRKNITLFCGEEGICPCVYEDTDAYQITRSFFNNREKMLRYLCGE